jgi:pyruvate/2-oxoglutarate dehydrogenase complex dihydrolipoamide acyltransferase (E2) component
MHRQAKMGQKASQKALKASKTTKVAKKQTKKATLAKRTIATKRQVPQITQSTPISNILSPKTVQKSNSTNLLRQTMRRFAAMPASGKILELPSLSPTMESGGLSKWHVDIGALIKPGDLIADVETDKAVVPFESQDEYFLAAVLIQSGTQNIPVGTPLGITVEEEGDIAAAQAYAATLSAKSPAVAAPAAAPKAVEAPVAKAPEAKATQGNGKTYTHRQLSPSVHLMVDELNIDVSNIKPTGGFGYLTKGDIMQAVENGTAVYLPKKEKGGKAESAAAAPAKTTTAATTTPAATAETGGRRRRARGFTDIPVTEGTAQQNKALVDAKIPANYESGTISLKKINSFINTHAKECDLNSAIVSMITKSVNVTLNTITKENDLVVIDKATGKKTLMSRHVATQIGKVFKKTQENTPSPVDSSLYNITLYTNLPTSTNQVIERVPTGAAMHITVGTPFNNVSFVGEQLSVEKMVQISVATDNEVLHEQHAANIIKSVKGFANEPVSMLL